MFFRLLCLQGESGWGGGDVAAVCGNGFGLAYSIHISQLASRVAGRGRGGGFSKCCPVQYLPATEVSFCDVMCVYETK